MEIHAQCLATNVGDCVVPAPAALPCTTPSRDVLFTQGKRSAGAHQGGPLAESFSGNPGEDRLRDAFIRDRMLYIAHAFAALLGKSVYP